MGVETNNITREDMFYEILQLEEQKFTENAHVEHDEVRVGNAIIFLHYLR